MCPGNCKEVFGGRKGGNPQMKILLTLPRMDSGGVETHIDYLARGFLKEGLQVVLVCKEGRKVKDLKKAGVIFRALDVASQSILTLPHRIKKMEKIIEEEKVDLVHAHSRVPAWIGYYAARRKGVPFITTAHGQYSLHLGSKVMALGTRVIAVSDTVAGYLQKGWNIPGEKFQIIPEGIDPAQFILPSAEGEKVRQELGIGKDDMVIGTVGRMTSVKGHRYLIEAFSLLEEDCKLLLVGDGRKRAELGKLAIKLDIRDRVIFAGDREDVPRFLGAMDIYVQSSLAEGLGLAALEAMAAGLPVILTRCGGLADQVRAEQEALLVPPGESCAMAKAIKNLIMNEELRRKLSSGGRELVRARFSPEVMINETIKVYREVLQGKGGI